MGGEDNLIMKCMFCLLAALFSLVFANVASAEIITLDGKGEYLMTDETLDYAKNMAKTEAERDISRQAYMHVMANSKNVDNVSDFDEIVGDTESIMHIIAVKYSLTPEGDNYVIHAAIKAEIDTDELERVLGQR